MSCNLYNKKEVSHCWKLAHSLRTLPKGDMGPGSPLVSPLLVTITLNIHIWGNWKIKAPCATFIKNCFSNKYCDIYYVLFCSFHLLQCPPILSTSPGMVWEQSNAVYKGSWGRTHFHQLRLSGDRHREMQENTESIRPKALECSLENTFPHFPLTHVFMLQAGRYLQTSSCLWTVSCQQHNCSQLMVVRWQHGSHTLFVSSNPFLKEGLKSRPFGQI